MNLGWLLAGVAALTWDDDGPTAAAAALLAVTWAPTLGLVAVGQMTMPVLTGIALGLYALDRRAPWGLGLAAFLMSYKWHVGAIPALGGLVLLARDPPLLRRTLFPVAAWFGGASILSLGLDPRWPAEMVRSVLALAVADVNLVCDTCASVAWTLSGWLDLRTSAVGLVLLLLGAAAIGWRGLVRDARAFMGAVVALTLVCLPYVRNYDHAILSVALVAAWQRATAPWHRAVVVGCWAAALALPALPRTLADDVLGSGALAVLALLVAVGPRAGAPPDDAPHPAG